MVDQSKQPEQPSNSGEAKEKLLADKYKSVEALEEGYKQLARLQTETADKLKKSQTDFLIPDDYLKPADTKLSDDEIAHLKGFAKDTQMTQRQFDNLLANRQAAKDAEVSRFEEEKKKLGEEKINLITDYVKRFYPANMVDKMVKTCLEDPLMAEAALGHRSKLLNTGVPGISNTSAPAYHVSYEDVIKAREKAESQPANQKYRENYLKIMGVYAKQKEEKSNVA